MKPGDRILLRPNLMDEFVEHVGGSPTVASYYNGLNIVLFSQSRGFFIERKNSPVYGHLRLDDRTMRFFTKRLINYREVC